jgi:tetratricopeptide (TPR) repeat protein
MKSANTFPLVIVGLLFTVNLFAQKAKVVSTYNYLKYNELDKAKEAIDLAAEHPDTKEMAKTWFYRGQVYYMLAISQEESFKALHPDPISVAYESLKKAYTYDTKKIDINELDQAYAGLIAPLFGSGVKAYNEKKYDNAVAVFEKCIDINNNFKRIDTLSYYNAGLAAERAGNTDVAASYYRKCIELNYGGGKIFANLADVYKTAGNEAEALKVLKEGRTKYPNEQELITSEINLYLKNENYQEALGNLDLAIKNDPSNPTFYFARGSIYDQQKDLVNAEADYKKAIELKPEFFDANYNLGALFFNDGAEIYNQANDLPLKEAKKATELRAKAENKFKLALPYLEKAHELNPQDKSTMLSLKQLYVRTNQTEKYNSINEKLNN